MTPETISLENTQTDLPARAPRSKFSRGLRTSAWILLAVFSLLIFTIAKLPSVRIKNYVQGTIAAQLAQRGIGFSVDQGYISVGFGISYVMKDITLTFPPPEEPVKIESVTVSPSFFSLLTGRMGGDVDIRNGDGKLSASFAARSSSMKGSFTAKDFDLGKIGIFPMMANIKGAAVISGDGSFAGDPGNLGDLSGDFDINLKKIVIDQQNVMGFGIPKISVSEGKLLATSTAGKMQVKTLTLGKKGSTADDIQADVSGDIGLNKYLDNSSLNLNAKFSLSQPVMKAFPLIDAFLGPGKLPDGSFSYHIGGTFGAPAPVPAGK